jgi:hypothetical protein
MSSASSKGHHGLQIIRLYSDYSAVIRIAVPFLDDLDVVNTKSLERLGSITTFLDDFLLIWD